MGWAVSEAFDFCSKFFL